MSTVQNKIIARRYFEDMWNKGDVAVSDELITADIVGHVSGTTLHGIETLKQRLSTLYAIYSEPRFTIEDQMAEGDKVLTRWTFRGKHTGETMGAAPTGKQVTVTGMNLFRLTGGKITEIWLNADDLGELQQLGIIPVPAQ
jgi:predicted ester cyclase